MSDVISNGATAHQGRSQNDIWDEVYRHGVVMGAGLREGRLGRHRIRPDEIEALKLIRGQQPGPNLFWFPRTPGWRYGEHLYFHMNDWDNKKVHESAAFWADLNLHMLADNPVFLTGWVDGILGIDMPRPRSRPRRRRE